MLLEVQHRGDSCIIDRWRSRPHADGVRLPLSHSRKMDEQSSNKHGAAPRSVVRWVRVMAVPLNRVWNKIQE